MNRLQKLKLPSLDASTLRAWEDMRIEILHEIQDGGSMSDELVNAAADLAALDSPWSRVKPPATRITRFHVN